MPRTPSLHDRLLDRFIGNELLREARAGKDVRAADIHDLKKLNKGAYDAFVEMLIEDCGAEFSVDPKGKVTATHDGQTLSFEESTGWTNDGDDTGETGWGPSDGPGPDDLVEEGEVSSEELEEVISTLSSKISAKKLVSALNDAFGERELDEEAREDLYAKFPRQMEQIENGEVRA